MRVLFICSYLKFKQAIALQFCISKREETVFLFRNKMMEENFFFKYLTEIKLLMQQIQKAFCQ
jgi:hypothetical protein